MRIVVHDHAGHTFAPELSRELAARGHEVRHLYCSTFASAKADLAARDDDPPGLTIGTLAHRRPFAKYSYGRRAGQEIEYGIRAARALVAMRPDVVLSANTPMLSQAIITRRLALVGITNVLWLQDIYSDAVAGVVRAWPWPVGRVVARTSAFVDAATASRSDSVVTISPRFRDRLVAWGVDPDRVEVVPNWAPLDEVPVGAKDNPWSRSTGLTARFVVAYTGILGLKHDAATLYEVASRMRQATPATLLVVSGGPGFDWLASRAHELGAGRLVCLPFQPPQVYPSVLATADVLLSVLTTEASGYSVPSKVLTYLCAGRPTVASMPPDNDAARMLEAAGAGTVVAPGDVDAIMDAIEELRADVTRRGRMGASARARAEASFPIGPIADRFESLLARARRERAAARAPA